MAGRYVYAAETWLKRTVSRGSNKRVVRLDAAGTINYICYQIIDMLHDSSLQFVSIAEISAIANLYVDWICVVNDCWNQWDRIFEWISTHISNIFNPSISVSNNVKMILESRKDKVISESGALAPADSSVIVDSCPPSVMYCVKGSERVISTWSTMYDNGSFSKTCGTASEVLLENRDVEFRPRYPIRDEAKGIVRELVRSPEPRQYFRVFNCASAPFTTNVPYDLAVIGVLPSNPSINIVLAFRALHLVPLAIGGVACVFGLQSDFGTTTAFGSAQKQKTCAAIFRQLVHSAVLRIMDVPNSMDVIMRTYTELSSKHWGDLGLVIEASRDTKRCVTTEDHVLALLCSCLGAKYLIDGKMYEPSVSSSSCSRVDIEDSASIFDKVVLDEISRI